MTVVLQLKKRKDFLRVAKQGEKMVASTIILQAAQNLSVSDFPRIGFTTTKKIGKAHLRNRARRRMRAALHENYPLLRANTDYVLIGRYNTADCPYEKLCKDINWSIKKINKLIESSAHAPISMPPADCPD